MAQKDVGNKVPIYKLKETKEVMDFYDEWGLDNKYDKDMVEWNYTGPKETVEVFNKHQKEKDIEVKVQTDESIKKKLIIKPVDSNDQKITIESNSINSKEEDKIFGLYDPEKNDLN